VDKNVRPKLDNGVLLLTCLLNFWNGLKEFIKGPMCHSLVIVFLVVISMVLGFVFKYDEVNRQARWDHYVKVTIEQTKKQEIENSVRYIMGIYCCDSLIVYEEIMKSFDPVLVATVIAIESEYRVNAISSSGALGLMQVMPYHYKRNEKWNDPVTNIRVGSRYLQEMLKLFNGNVELTLSAYNAGPDSVIKAGYKVPTNTKTGETVPYVARGMKHLNHVSYFTKTLEVNKLNVRF
jgi:hypothetical protein